MFTRHLFARSSTIALLTALSSTAALAQTGNSGAVPCKPTTAVPCPPDAPQAGDGSTSTTSNDVLSGGNAKAAQSGPDTPITSQTVNADGSTAGDSDGTVVVTGSRIRRRNYDTVSPTITTDRQYVDERNITNVADAVNNQPGVRGSITPNGAQGSFGQGVNFINLGNLGSNRTLTLLNGRRFVSSNPNTLFNQGSAGSQVDVNVVQTILLDHVETISITGATTYGSDAIAGTVNYILRDRYNPV